jgi:hypothetical protein
MDDASAPDDRGDRPADAVREDGASPVKRALLEDGSLALAADAAVWDAVEPWVPRVPPRAPAHGEVRAWMRARAGAPAFFVPTAAPVLDLRGVLGWIRPSGEILLHAPGGRASAVVDLAARNAEVRLRDPSRDEAGVPGVEVFAALTLASAFLVGRLGRTLTHAGAVVGPDGRAWLLAGGTFSGKTTTCLNLVRGGWDYLADDHVVLGPARGGGVEVEGWPRRFNLDLGYPAGESRGVRARVDPEDYGPGRWRPRAPLGGVLFPRVEAASSTAVAPLHPAGALSRLLQQSPWLLADAGAAPSLLALLERAARHPAFELRLGADSYADPARLRAVVEPALLAPAFRIRPAEGAA